MFVSKKNELKEIKFIQKQLFSLKHSIFVRKMKTIPQQNKKLNLRQQYFIPIQKRIFKLINLQIDISSRNMKNEDNSIETMKIFDKITFKNTVLLRNNRYYNYHSLEDIGFNLYDCYNDEIINNEYYDVEYSNDLGNLWSQEQQEYKNDSKKFSGK